MTNEISFVIVLSCLVVCAVAFSIVLALVRRKEPAPEQPNLKTVAFARTGVGPEPKTVAAGRPAAKTISIIHDFGNADGVKAGQREYLTVREAFEVLAEIRAAGENAPIDVILHTPGGSAFACELIAGALKDRPNTTTYVPYCAMSAGTIVALSTEKVVMGRNACLGPIDSQFMGIPADAFQRLLKEKPIQSIEDMTVLVSYIVEKDQKNARARACSLMNKHHFGTNDACRITDFLVSGDMPHSEQIGRERAKELGVNIVGADCPDFAYKAVEERLELLRREGGSGGDFFDRRIETAPSDPGHGGA